MGPLKRISEINITDKDMKRTALLILLTVLCSPMGLMAAGKLSKAFNDVAAIKGFTTETITVDDYGFPPELGKGVMTGYGNAEPRDKVLAILDKLPASLKVLEQTDEDNRVQRYYFEPAKEAGGEAAMMYVFVGVGPNDTMLLLFTGADEKIYSAFAEQVKELGEEE